MEKANHNGLLQITVEPRFGMKPAAEPSYQERYLRRDEAHRVRHHEALWGNKTLLVTATVQSLMYASYCSDLACWGMGQTEDSSPRISHQERIGEADPKHISCGRHSREEILSRVPTIEQLPVGQARWSVECQTATSHNGRCARCIGPFP